MSSAEETKRDPTMHRAVFTGLLVLAMAAGTFVAASLGVLATFIIDDFQITRAQLGLVIGAVTVLAAVFSLPAGRVADVIGGKRGLIAVFALSALAIVTLGVAPVYVVLFVGAILGAAGQSGANPATNRLIAEDLPPGEQGVVTGIKQSGVQMGISLGGFLLPSLALAVGWRGAYLLVATVPLAAVAVTWWLVPRDHPTAATAGERSEALPPFVRWLALYGFLLGLAASVNFLVPLYAEEELGLDPRLGGLAVGVWALVAVFGRIVWARFAEVRSAFSETLGILAALSILGSFLYLASQSGAAWLLWVGAIVGGASYGSWNAVGMLAVISGAGRAATGRASGIVVFGFLTGLGIGPPIFGAIIDRTGSYTPMWLVAIAASGLALGTVIAWRRRT